MTVYRLAPKPHKSRGGNPLAGLYRFVTDPVGEILGAAVDSRNAADAGSNVENALPVSVDDEYDTLTIDAASTAPGAPIMARRFAESRQRLADQALPILQRVYETGMLQPGIPKPYQAFARDIAAIGAAKLARGPTPEQPAEQITLPRSDTGQNFMGGFIPPGGVMGFANMTPASQLALTRGARGTRRSPKRRKTRTKKARKAKTRRTKRAKPARLKKGSAAAKRYMAKIRRKRKK